MTKSLIPYKPRDVPMRSSAWDTFRACPRKFLFQERYGLKARGRYSPALFIGDVAHTIITSVYQGTPLEEAERAAARKMGEAISKCSDKQRDIEKDYTMGRMLANVYFDHFEMSLKGFTIVQELIERLLTYDHPDYVSPIMGRLDMVLKDSKGDYWIWDLKTVSSSISTVQRAATILFDPQPWFYKILLANELRKQGEVGKVKGILHVLLQKPSLRLKKGEVFKDYVQRCVLDFYDTRMKQAKESPDVHPPLLVSRVKFPSKTPRWVHTMLWDLDRHSADEADPEFFYPDKNACFNYNSKCPFLPVCQASESTWPVILGTHFEQSFREDEEKT